MDNTDVALMNHLLEERVRPFVSQAGFQMISPVESSRQVPLECFPSPFADGVYINLERDKMYITRDAMKNEGYAGLRESIWLEMSRLGLHRYALTLAQENRSGSVGNAFSKFEEEMDLLYNKYAEDIEAVAAPSSPYYDVIEETSRFLAPKPRRMFLTETWFAANRKAVLQKDSGVIARIGNAFKSLLRAVGVRRAKGKDILRHLDHAVDEILLRRGEMDSLLPSAVSPKGALGPEMDDRARSIDSSIDEDLHNAFQSQDFRAR